jgi:pyrroloquinoline quinone biosynthesis protein D
MLTEDRVGARPRLRAGVRLEWDAVRERHVLLCPEGILALNSTGAAILALCDGRRTVAAIAEQLRADYREVVELEIEVFLQRLAHKRMVAYDGER